MSVFLELKYFNLTKRLQSDAQKNRANCGVCGLYLNQKMKYGIKGYLIIIFCIIFLSCSYKTNKNLDTFSQAENSCFQIFRSTKDVEEAESTLLKFRKIVIKYQNEKVEGIDYNAVLMQIDIRLYLIETYKGNQYKAEGYLKRGSAYISENGKISENDFREWKKRVIEFLKKSEKNTEWIKKI